MPENCDLADLVLTTGFDGKGYIHEGFFRCFFRNLGLGPCDPGFEVAVLEENGQEILLSLKDKAAARVILAGKPPAGSLERRHLRRAGAAEADVCE